MKIFVTVDGEQQGPHSVDEMRTLLSAGKLSMGDFAWYEGCAEWNRLHDMPELVAAVLPPVPGRTSTPPPLPAKEAREPSAASTRPAGPNKPTHWWNRELWPDPTVAQLERRKSFWSKTFLVTLLTSGLLLGIGWLVEGKSKEEERGLPQQTRYNPFSFAFRLASGGPIGFLGAMSFAGAMALGVVLRAVDSQLEDVRKKASANQANSQRP